LHAFPWSLFSTYKSDIINNGFPVRRQVINDFVWY
jgi:hypothetical protein